MVVIPALLGAISMTGQEALLSDGFNDNTIDPALWTIALPFPNAPASAASESNGSLELFRRGVLSAARELPASLDVQGRFRFVGDNDTFSVVIRSDLTVTNQAERRGVQAAFQESSGKIFLIAEPFVSTPIPASAVIGKNRDVNFRITDHAGVVRVYLEDLFSPLITATVTNRRGNRLCLYNYFDTASRMRLDQISVHPLQTTTFVDGALLRGGMVRTNTAVQVAFQSFFTNSSIYYTLDGSAPSFIASEYRGPFLLDHSATLRAVAYSADFLETSESPAVKIEVLPLVVLTNATPGGGVIQFTPAGNIYLSNTIVSVAAMPAPGWQFLRWEGALGGSISSNQLTLTNHSSLRAVFGTTLALTTIGPGQIQTSPAGPVFPYGSKVRLMASPAPGNYFFRWANAVTGTASPGTLEMTNAQPAVSALFSGLNGGQVTLNAGVTGDGTISLQPSANVFTNGQHIVLRAVPDAEQVFLGWSGDLTGSDTPATLVMEGDKRVTARFAPGIRFFVTPPAFGSNGFSMLMRGEPGFAFVLEASADAFTWNHVATLTNVSGLLRYDDTLATNAVSRIYRVVGP